MLNEKTYRLRKTVDSFISFIRTLSDKTLQPSAWGPREVLVHLVFWHETYVSTLSTLREGRQPVLMQGTFKQLNAFAMEKNAEHSVEQLVERFKTSQANLEELTARPMDSSFPIVIKASSEPRRLDALIDEIEAHIRSHEFRLSRKDLMKL